MNKVQQPSPSTAVIVVFASVLSFIAFLMASILPIKLNLPKRNDLFEIFVGIFTILFGIGFTVFVLRKRDGQVSFGKLFIAGWMTALVMSVLTVIFYFLAQQMNWLGFGDMPAGVIPTVLLKYNALGMMISALLAIIFKKQ